MKYCFRLSFCFLLVTAAAAFGQTTSPPPVMSTSAGNYRAIVAPDSIVSSWGSNFAIATTVANTSNPGSSLVVLPNALGGVSISITDSANVRYTPGLFLVSPGQINYVLPATVPVGRSTITITGPNGTQTGTMLVSNVAPSIFSADLSGSGAPAAQILRAGADGTFVFESPVAPGSAGFTPNPIDLRVSANDQVFIFLYGTGIRRRSLNPVIATIGGISVPVQFAGAQSQYPGLDQINIGPVPATIAGLGTADVVVTVDGVPANTVRLAFR